MRDDLFVEVPSRTITDPVVILQVGPFLLRVIAKEVVLADRTVGFKYWGVTDYGLQAIAMLTAFGSELDLDALNLHLDREGARDAYEILRRLGEASEAINDMRLEAELQVLRNKPGSRE